MAAFGPWEFNFPALWQPSTGKVVAQNGSSFISKYVGGSDSWYLIESQSWAKFWIEIQISFSWIPNQHRRVLNVIVKVHHVLLTGAEYDSMCKFRVGSVAIRSGSPEEQAAVDYRERGLSYTKTTLLINQKRLQDGRPRVTRSADRTCELNMVQDVGLLKRALRATRIATKTGQRLP